MKRVVLITSSVLLLGLFQNCSEAKFGQDSSASDDGNGALGQDGNGGNYSNHLNQPNTNPNSCYTVLHQITTDVKILFVVDKSGSNTSSNEGTDPDMGLRGGSIQAFLDDLKSKPNFDWGFLYFKDSSAKALIGTDSNPTFSTPSVMQTAITKFYDTKDSGGTPYQAAFELAKKTIQNDSNVSNSPKWIVVFISDGLPNPTMNDAQLKAGVSSVTGLRPGQVTFNTIYYGPKNDSASGRLKLMAAQGGGYFLDTNSNPTAKDFLISNVVNVPGTVCEH